jgi:hypothetical protein
MLDNALGGGAGSKIVLVHGAFASPAGWVADTAAYLARKQAEGKSRREALRRLKRHLARRVWRLLQPHADLGAPTASPPPTITIHCNVPNGGLSLT